MDPRERVGDLEESIRLAVDRHLGDMWTAMPVSVMEDSEGHTCELQVTIKGQEQGRNGEIQSFDRSPLGDVPIHFAAGGGLTITHPVKEKDEGMVVFQSRCVDAWKEKGGQQEEPYRRRHAPSDGMFIPGFRNKVRKLDPKPSDDSVQIRTDDGKFYIELTKDGVCNIYAKEVKVHAPKIRMDGVAREVEKKNDHSEGKDSDMKDTAVHIEGTLHVTKDITCEANIRADKDVTAKKNMTANQTVTGKQEVIARNIRMTSHVHTKVQSGGGMSGPPRP